MFGSRVIRKRNDEASVEILVTDERRISKGETWKVLLVASNWTLPRLLGCLLFPLRDYVYMCT